MINNKKTITIGWCDNGIVDGKFTEGLVSVVLAGPQIGFPITSTLRVQGNQIARQRQVLIDTWYDNMETEWLIWVDSDIVLNIDILQKLLSSADKEDKPMVSGVYFISKQTDGSLPVILPSIFNDVDEHTIKYHHPLPENTLLKVDSAGMGLIVMHRSVVKKLRNEFNKETPLFGENNMLGEKFIGEDIAFFRKCKKAGIPLYAHTGAIAKHNKITSWDIDLYNLYWSSKNKQGD